MTKHMLPDKQICKIEMAMFNNGNFGLQGLRFYDNRDDLFYQVGKFDSNFLVKEVLLEEGEQIVGFASKKGVKGNARHGDL